MSDGISTFNMVLVAQDLDGSQVHKFIDNSNFKDWLRIYVNYCKKYAISEGKMLANVGFYLSRPTGKCHNHHEFND